MKHIFDKPILSILGIIGVIVIITLSSILTARSQNLPQSEITDFQWTATPTRPPWCKSLPYKTVIEGTSTPTPNILTQMVPVNLPEQPTRTPYPITHIIDLAPDLPLEDKGTALVFRCNGEMDEYLTRQITYPDLLKVINLGEGDVLLTLAAPASLMGHQPPLIVPTSIITQTPIPYP